MTNSAGGTGLTGKSDQVFIQLADGTFVVAALPASVYLENLESLQNLMVAKATGDKDAEAPEIYKTLREELVFSDIKDFLPRFIFTNRTLAVFWQYIKTKFTTYRERREFIWGEFKPLLEGLEAGTLYSITTENNNIRPLTAVTDIKQQPQLFYPADVVKPPGPADNEIRTILFLSADPTNVARLRLGQEVRDIQERL